MDESSHDDTEQRERDLTPDPFSCGIISFLLLLFVLGWLVLVYVISRGW